MGGGREVGVTTCNIISILPNLYNDFWVFGKSKFNKKLFQFNTPLRSFEKSIVFVFFVQGLVRYTF